MNTRLLSQPAASSAHIAFIYAEDLWIADADGSDPRRLTVDEGIESDPFFSPDGKIIAFSAQYDGNTDVYSVPVTGGVPLRLTWHPGDDLARGFTPDGKKVLFASQRKFSQQDISSSLRSAWKADCQKSLIYPMPGQQPILRTGQKWLMYQFLQDTSSGRTTGAVPHRIYGFIPLAIILL
ncbi:MAG: hypothetical protein MZV63_04705 [Marinilabiliales bacterium]|nr:hypothetical protein [Marinilabiliales bacterium]